MEFPKWIFEKQTIIENTPSRKEGIDFETELNEREETSIFILTLGKLLDLNEIIICTSQYYFHRVFLKYSFNKEDSNQARMMAAGCVLLASKIHECAKKTRDIINCYHFIITGGQQILEIGDHFHKLRADLVLAESRVLRALCFDLDIVVPNVYLLHFSKSLSLSQSTFKIASKLLNDSMTSILCLLCTPVEIACGCIHLASKISDKEIPFPCWYEVFGVDTNKVVFVVSEIMSLISKSNEQNFHNLNENQNENLKKN
ncbi:cyclin [Anaeramoeba ignava]|uniref:Cyclin n=1 Tax=Anaeramoeba ignava TaxID=1746090 RepID=A0A9Q0L662_ANAIG|nr:cyclin [Anaeramoeba ignava]